MFIRPALVAAAIVIAAVGSASPAYARGGHGGGSGGSGGGHGDGCYTAKSGDCVERPTRAPSRPPGATAPCRDGTWSFSENPGGTCSGHGGVESGGFRSETHYVGQTPKKRWTVWAGTIEGGYKPVAGQFRTADDAKAFADGQVA